MAETRTHNDLYELTARSTQPNPLQYDANGNLTDDGVNYLYEWDANDMLQMVKNRATMAVIAEYRYDSMGRRVEKNVGGAITRYYLAGDQVVEERRSRCGHGILHLWRLHRLPPDDGPADTALLPRKPHVQHVRTRPTTRER